MCLVSRIYGIVKSYDNLMNDERKTVERGDGVKSEFIDLEELKVEPRYNELCIMFTIFSKEKAQLFS